MNAGEFIRRRTQIEREHQRGRRWQSRAMHMLTRQAGADEVRVNGKLVGWLLNSGERVCIKTRYSDEGAALFAIEQIANWPGALKRPSRAYQCKHCSGWHLTSR